MPEFRPIVIITHPAFLFHDTGDDHPETAERIFVILDALHKSPLRTVTTQVAPVVADFGWLTAVHSQSYLFRFEEQALSGHAYLGHPDNQMCYETYEAALLSAGAGLMGVDLLERHAGSRLPFCCVRPPGHHAEKAMAMGFCFLNNTAIAARYWQQKHGRQKVAIIDWDAHHGNGIQAVFEEDPDVLYVSIHEHPTFSYPGSGFASETGSGRGLGATMNIPLPPGAGDPMVRRVVAEQIEPALGRFRPAAIIIAAGFDGHQCDDMSGLVYTTELYRYLGECAASWGRKYCENRVLSILEGGYHLESLAAGVDQYLQGIAGNSAKE